jgi:hypothetical protein
MARRVSRPDTSTGCCAQSTIVPRLGARRLRDLTAREVDRWLAGLAQELSSEPVHRTHACLNRAVRRAMARDLVSRNVVDLAEVPSGLAGRPSKSLTAEHVDQVLTLTVSDRMHNYIVVSLLTGGRTEELRALEWAHVHLDGDPDPGPAGAALHRGLAVGPLGLAFPARARNPWYRRENEGVATCYGRAVRVDMHRRLRPRAKHPEQLARGL